MKYLLCLLAALFALPAYALSVSNLDVKTHSVVFEETQGSKVTRIVPPNKTIHVPATSGRVFLEGNPSQAVRVDQLDRLAIWPEGNLQIQMRRKGHGRD